MPGLNLLITSGATREPIDDVRYISNVSTGKTGAALASFFSEAGFEVTYLGGRGAAEPACACRTLEFLDYRSLDSVLKRELTSQSYFAVIHLAAVADYSVSEVKVGGRAYSPDELRKIDSGDDLALVLKRNAKILDRIKGYALAGAPRDPLVVGFKLTHVTDEGEQSAAVNRIVRGGGVDIVVHNDLGQIRSGGGIHRFGVYAVRNGEASLRKNCRGTDELGAAMIELFREYL